MHHRQAFALLCASGAELFWGKSSPSHKSREMHQARHIGRRDHFRAGLAVVGNSVESHLAGNGLFADGERTAKPTALIFAFQRDDFDTVDLLQELSGLTKVGPDVFAAGTEPQFPQPMAALVQANAMRKLCLDTIDFEHIDQELAQFVRPLAKRDKFVIAWQIVFVVPPNHGGATARRANDMGVLAERAKK